MRRVWTYVSDAIEFITKDDVEDSGYLLFPAVLPPTVTANAITEKPSATESHSTKAVEPGKPLVTPICIPTPLAGDAADIGESFPSDTTQPSGKFTPSAFASHVEVLRSYEDELHALAHDAEPTLEEEALDALRGLAETLVWADKSDPAIWDAFMEHKVMELFVQCLEASRGLLRHKSSLETATVRRYIAVRLQSAILRTLAIVIQSVTRPQSLYQLFTANHINALIEFEYELHNDEILGYYISLLKSIAMKLDKSMLQLFFDPARGSFPLYSCAIRFFDHPERMTRIAVRNITLQIFAVADAEATSFALKSPGSFPQRIVTYLVRLCGSVARAIELILDDGMEVPRNRQRTGLFRKRVRSTDVSVRLAEVEHIALYICDLYALPSVELGKELRRLITTRLFAPLFRPIASRASLSSLALPRRRWSLRDEEESERVQCLAPFDAAARALVLSFVLSHMRDSPLILHLLSEIARPNRIFEGRSVLNALKAMIGDLTGTERVSYIALRAVEMILSSTVVSPRHMDIVQLVFEAADPSTLPYDSTTNLSTIDRIGSFVESLPDDEPVLMTLTDFEAPLTPCVSLPSTPKFDDNNPSSPMTEARASELSAAAVKRTTLKQDASEESGRIDEEEILRLFRTGDAPLRDTLSAALLVVRRREARSLRLIQAVSRIIVSMAQKTKNWLLAMDAIAAILEVLASSLREYCDDPRTTASMLSASLTNYRLAFSSEMTLGGDDESEIIFSSERLAQSSALKPKSAGKRRLAVGGDITPPVELEDATVMLVMVLTYEEAYRRAYEGLEAKLSSKLRSVVDGVTAASSASERREALNDIADIALEAQSSP